MRRFTRPLAFVAGAALAVTGVTLATLPSQAQTVEFTKLQLATGYTFLNTTTNRVTTSPGTASQTITSGCDLTDVLSPAATLLDVNALGTRVSLGYNKNGIGVSGQKDKSGTRCADVDAEYGQSLELKVGSQGGGLWSAADLDIEFKGGSSLAWTAWRGPTNVTSNVTIGGLPGDRADNGPDSGDGDNYRVTFTTNGTAGYFDRLVLAPTSGGSFSLEGGGDGTAASSLVTSTNASVFQTLGGEGLLQCGNTGISENGVSVFLVNCSTGAAVPYQLDRTPGTNNVIFSVPDSSTNEYRVEIEWTPETAQLPVPASSSVAYFRNSGGSLVQQSLGLCSGTATSPIVPPITVPSGATAIPNGEGFCIVGQSMQIGPVNGRMVVTERLYGKGDPAFNRLSN
jgi:hypothetical protein